MTAWKHVGEDSMENSPIIREESTPGCYIKARYVLALMGFLGMFNLYSLRTNLSVAIVAMANLTSKELTTNSNETICSHAGSPDITNSGHYGTFNWNAAEQGLLLGSYYYGYICTGMPGGYLTKRFGVRVIFGTSMLLSSIITILFPIMAYASFKLIVVCRILLGFLQGVSSPSMISAWGKWAPPAERSVLVSLSFAGGSFGTVVTLPLAGLISDKIGWEAVFYFTGGVALLWSIVWLSIIHSSPQQHPRISQAERVYIIQSIGTDKVENAETPWKDIMTSRCVWAIIAGQFANDWGSYTLLALLPTYMATILKFNLSESGELSALPFVLQFFFSVSGGYVTEWIRCRMMISTIVLRKLNTSLGLIVPAISIVLAGYIGCDFKAAVAFFSLSVAFSALNIPGCISNAIDIAPKYGGVIYGISNTIANTAGFLAPQVAGLMLRDEDSISQWQEVFWVAAVVYSLGAVIYLVLGSAEEQTWASGHSVCKSKDEGDGSEEEFLRVNSERADYR